MYITLVWLHLLCLICHTSFSLINVMIQYSTTHINSKSITTQQNTLLSNFLNTATASNTWLTAHKPINHTSKYHYQCGYTLCHIQHVLKDYYLCLLVNVSLCLYEFLHNLSMSLLCCYCQWSKTILYIISLWVWREEESEMMKLINCGLKQDD